MSVFEGAPPGAWLAEKTLTSLEVAASLVDLANEPDTTAWYRKELNAKAQLLVGRLAPLVAYLHGAGQDAASHSEWGIILESGTFGLARWCREWDIVDPHVAAFDATVPERDADELEAKAQEADVESDELDDLETFAMREAIHNRIFHLLLYGNLGEVEKRLLSFLGHRLTWSPGPADEVTFSRRFLPTDIDASVEETSVAYRALYERGLLDRVMHEDIHSDAVCVRLVCEPFNARKHPTPYAPVEFGGAGTRLGGEPTTGQMVSVTLEGVDAKKQRLWGLLDETTLETIAQHVGDSIGQDRIHVERVEFSNDEKTQVTVQYRHRISEVGERTLEMQVLAVVRHHIDLVLSNRAWEL